MKAQKPLANKLLRSKLAKHPSRESLILSRLHPRNKSRGIQPLKNKVSLSEKLKIDNPMALPKVEKVVVFSGLGRAKVEKELFEQAKEDLAKITGQTPVITRAKKSIATFKIREGDVVGLKVTLRGARMVDFLEKLARIVLPTQRDFKGILEKNLDGGNNLNIGFREHIVFPEVRHENIAKIFGLQVSIRIKAKNKEEAKELLKTIGFPFEKGE